MFFCSIFDVKQLVLENGAFQPPKGFVLSGFYVEMLLRLEDCSLNRAPVLGVDRCFNAILPLPFRIDFSPNLFDFLASFWSSKSIKMAPKTDPHFRRIFDIEEVALQEPLGTVSGRS